MPLDRARRLALYVLSFAVGRGGLFAAPLVLANLLGRRDYGALETAQAAASVAANVAAMGTAALVPLVLLGTNGPTTMSAIVAHHLGVVALCAAFALLSPALGADSTWTLAAVLTAAIALQSLWSIELKTRGRGDASVLLDAALFCLLAVAAIAARWSGVVEPMRWIWAATLAYTAALALTLLLKARNEPSGLDVTRWRAAASAGIPLMLGGLVSLLATTSGRLGMGLLAGPLVTADYAVLARAAAVPIVMHQLILIASFRSLFTLEPSAMERAVLKIVLLVSASAMVFWLLTPWLHHVLGPAFTSAWLAHPLAAVWIVAQSILWSAIALNDLVVTRHQVMLRIVPITMGCLSVALFAGWFVLQAVGTTLEHFVLVHAVVMLVFYVVQSAAMAANDIRLWRPWACAVASYALMNFLAWRLA
jgi:hypothetical protein